MKIQEIKKILPELEIESNKQFGFEREYYRKNNGSKVYVSNSIIDETRKLAAWIETETGIDDEVEIKIYSTGSVNKLMTRWKIYPIDGSCSICLMRFYEEELIILWKNDNYHLIRIGMPKNDIEVNIKMLKLRSLIHFDGNTIISYQEQSDNKNILRVKIPQLETLEPLSTDNAKKMGIELNEQWQD